MKTEEYIDKYLDKFKYNNNFENSNVFIGMKHMYDALEDERCLIRIRDLMENCAADDGEMQIDGGKQSEAVRANYGKLLFFMYEKTGDEKYQKAIEKVMHELKGYLDEQSDQCMPMEELYMTIPFYMEYETKYDKKEKYSDVVKQLEKAESQIETEDSATDQIGLYMAALIDTLFAMSSEIYEKYRKIQDMFKHALKKLLCLRDDEKDAFCIKGADNAGNAMAAYAILRACRMGIIIKEKYAPLGTEIIERLNDNNLEEIFKDTRTAGIFVSAYAEYLLFKKESEA